MRKRSKKHKGEKKLSQRFHFKRRMSSRFGEDITDDDIDKIVAQIQSGQTEVVERQSLRVVIHKIKFKGQVIHIPYDKHRKTPITALFDDETYDNMLYGES